MGPTWITATSLAHDEVEGEERRGEVRGQEGKGQGRIIANAGGQHYSDWAPDLVVALLRQHHFSDGIQQGFMRNHISGADLADLTDDQLWEFGMVAHNITKFRRVVNKMQVAAGLRWWS